MTSTAARTQRLAGFAFAFGDALLELDKDGAITWSLGGVREIFAVDESSIGGKNLSEFVWTADRAAVRNYLVLLRDNKRPNPIEIKIDQCDREPVPVLLSGIFLRQMNDAYFLAFRKTCRQEVAATAPNLWRKPDKSEEFARRVVALGQDRGSDETSLSFIQLDAFEGGLAKLPDSKHRDLDQAVLSLLKHSACEEGAVTRLGDGRYGFLHDTAADLESLRESVVRRTKDFDDSGRDIRVDAASLALSVLGGRPNSVEALAGVLRQVQNHPEESRKLFESAGALESLINQARDDYNMVQRRLSEKGFSLAFQPVVELESRAVHHFEVLTRLKNSQESPFAFVCAAEKSGLIKDFDHLICEMVVAWKADTANTEAVAEMAVNLSALSIEDGAFVADLRRLAASLGERRRSINFEITETGEIEDIEAVNAEIQALRKDGHKIYLDDFGVGQTSFQQLRKWNIDAVKIDGSYVRDALSDASTRHILKAMAGLCNGLGIECVAEMVENEETTKYLLKCGIKFGQGYLFGRPNEDISIYL